MKQRVQTDLCLFTSNPQQYKQGMRISPSPSAQIGWQTGINRQLVRLLLTTYRGQRAVCFRSAKADWTWISHPPAYWGSADRSPRWASRLLAESKQVEFFWCSKSYFFSLVTRLYISKAIIFRDINELSGQAYISNLKRGTWVKHWVSYNRQILEHCYHTLYNLLWICQQLWSARA